MLVDAADLRVVVYGDSSRDTVHVRCYWMIDHAVRKIYATVTEQGSVRHLYEVLSLVNYSIHVWNEGVHSENMPRYD